MRMFLIPGHRLSDAVGAARHIAGNIPTRARYRIRTHQKPTNWLSPVRTAFLALGAVAAVVIPNLATSGTASAGLSLPNLSHLLLSRASSSASTALMPKVQSILNPKGTTAPIPTAPSLPTTDAGLMAPISVTAAQSGVSPEVAVTWLYAPTGATATGAVVQLDKVSGAVATLVAQVRCGSCTTATFRNLTFGTAYEARVFPTDANGEGLPATSPTVTPNTICITGACVSLNATEPIGPANHSAAGLLNSLYPVGNDLADAKALETSIYRSSPIEAAKNTYDWSSYGVATSAGAQTIVGLDALWRMDHDNVAPTPWSNWSAYSQWITSTVTNLLATGKEIDYWDIYNEPGGANTYYSATAYASQTPALLLQQFLVAYRAIKAADPAAQVIGPELEYWADYPGQYGASAHTFDMSTFLQFAAANGIQLAAITWHEILNTFGPNPEENTLLPSIIEDHVAQARAIIASLPALGHPKIFITEFGMPEVQKIPGWDVAYLAALTNAGVDEASRSCWGEDCHEPDLDGLLYHNGKNPLPDYFDRVVYASMSGDMLSTASTSDTVSVLGSYNSNTDTVTALVGRGVGCTQNLILCPSDWVDSARGSPIVVSISMTVPWSSGEAHVVLSHISGALPFWPAKSPALTGAVAKIMPAGAGKGVLSFSIPSFADGDAYGITVTH
jgi:hypothetical protein